MTVLVCGEALFDLFQTGENGPGALTFEARAGGSPFNVAVGIARLGGRAALLTGLSTDLFGNRLAAMLAAEGVDTGYLVRRDRPTMLSVVGLDAEGGPEFAFYGGGSADCALETADLPALPPSVAGLHFGSYSIAVAPAADAFAAFAARHAARFVSLDPNVRPAIEPDMALWRRRIDRLRRHANLVKVSEEDLAHLHPGADPEAVLAKWAKGAELAVLTRGAREVVARRADDTVRVAPPPVAVVDTVGAGDSFQAALLAAIDPARLRRMPRKELEAILTRAARAAAITCTKPGANLPRNTDLPD